jgi:hypothetical protein
MGRSMMGGNLSVVFRKLFPHRSSSNSRYKAALLEACNAKHYVEHDFLSSFSLLFIQALSLRSILYVVDSFCLRIEG